MNFKALGNNCLEQYNNAANTPRKKRKLAASIVHGLIAVSNSGGAILGKHTRNMRCFAGLGPFMEICPYICTFNTCTYTGSCTYTCTYTLYLYLYVYLYTCTCPYIIAMPLINAKRKKGVSGVYRMLSIDLSAANL